MSTDIQKANAIEINREFNPPIEGVRIEFPRNKVGPAYAIMVYDGKTGKQIGFVRNIQIDASVQDKVIYCFVTRFLCKDKNHILMDEKNEPMTETVRVPCMIDVVDLPDAYGPDAFVEVNPQAIAGATEKQLKDYLGCRICGQKTDIMYNDKDGAKCEKHRGQATEILMKGE